MNEGYDIGMKSTFMEADHKIPRVEECYQRHLKKKRDSTKAAAKMAAAANMAATEEKLSIKRTQAGEDKEYWNFICAMLKPNNPFNSFQEFDNAKKSLHKMKNQGLWEAYGQMMVKHARFREVPHARHVFAANQSLLAAFGHEQSWRPLLPVLLKSVAPCNDGTPHLLQKPGDVQKMIAALKEVMSDSMLFKVAQKSKKDVISVLVGGGDPKKDKDKKSPKGKERPETFRGTVGERPTMFADDIMNAINFTLEHVVDIKMNIVDDVICVALFLTRRDAFCHFE